MGDKGVVEVSECAEALKAKLYREPSHKLAFKIGHCRKLGRGKVRGNIPVAACSPVCRFGRYPLSLIANIASGCSGSLLMSSPDPTSAPSQAQWFAPTRWSVVLAAGGNTASATKEALEKLCQHYWPPLYAYIRRQGLPARRAGSDPRLLAWFLESDHLRVANPELGKFRSFLFGSAQALSFE